MHQFWNIPGRKKRPPPLRIEKLHRQTIEQVNRRKEGYEKVIQTIENNAKPLGQNDSKLNRSTNTYYRLTHNLDLSPMAAYRMYWIRVLAGLIPKKVLHHKLPYAWRTELSHKIWRELAQQFNDSKQHDFLNWLDGRSHYHLKSMANEVNISHCPRSTNRSNPHIQDIFEHQLDKT